MVNAGATIVTLRVNGDSMNEEGILNGDYVILELSSDLKHLENKIIAARFLLAEDDTENIDPLVLLSLPLRGFAIKVYKGTEEEKSANRKDVYHILSRRKRQTPIKEYSDEIRTRVVRPIGEVLGIYRLLK